MATSPTHTRFPDGYLRLLCDHQYRSKYNHLVEQAKVDTPNKMNKIKKTNKPDRQIYIAPGLREEEETHPLPDTVKVETYPRPDNSQPVGSMESSVVKWTSEDGRLFIVDMNKVDVDSYIEKARPSLRDAIQDPGLLLPRVLEDVGAVIVNRAWEDVTYHSTAANLCAFIAEKEKDSEKYHTIPQFAFRRCLSVQCKELIHRWDEMRAARVDWWTSFAKFAAIIFQLLSENSTEVGGLSDVVYDIIQALLTPLCLPHTQEQELLSFVFESCGKHLQRQDPQRMVGIVNKLRDLFLEVDAEPDLRNRLLQLIELHASKWNLSDSAKFFYNSSK